MKETDNIEKIAGVITSRVQVQNALRVLCRRLEKNEELIFMGGDLFLFRGKVCRTEDVADLLVPGASCG